MRLCLFKSTDPKADMEIDLEHVVRWIESLDSFSIYLIFGVIAYVENILPPIPGDLLVAFGGYLVASGLISFMPVLTITTVASVFGFMRSEEHTSELQSRGHLVCRLLLEKKKNKGPQSGRTRLDAALTTAVIGR